jgi:hypothetical protein
MITYVETSISDEGRAYLELTATQKGVTIT